MAPLLLPAPSVISLVACYITAPLISDSLNPNVNKMLAKVKKPQRLSFYQINNVFFNTLMKNNPTENGEYN
ncbi:hypothetical protein SMTE5_22630 [Serratia marcescens]|nr:hypothetical protein SME20J_23170 [Serratia marcescens]BEO81232.1 hypothetical protein SMTE5_22630 [Serratia marcescens]